MSSQIAVVSSCFGRQPVKCAKSVSLRFFLLPHIVQNKTTIWSITKLVVLGKITDSCSANISLPHHLCLLAINVQSKISDMINKLFIWHEHLIALESSQQCFLPVTPATIVGKSPPAFIGYNPKSQFFKKTNSGLNLITKRCHCMMVKNGCKFRISCEKASKMCK